MNHYALLAESGLQEVSKAVHFVGDLPRNGTGKLQKNLLRQRFVG